MGKFEIGARVRDREGYEGTIIDKWNDKRLVHFDEEVKWGGDHDMWCSKSTLTIVPSKPWRPAVGDRVVWLGKFNATMYTQGRVYEIKKELGKPDWLDLTDDDNNAESGHHMCDVDSIVEHFRLFRLEAGKFYRTRDGRKAGPMEKRDGYFSANGMHYDEAGRCAYMGEYVDGDEWRHNLDIVAEWVELAVAASVPQPKFKVGDRVRIVGGHPYILNADNMVGELVGASPAYHRGEFEVRLKDGQVLGFHVAELAPSHDLPAIGTRVTITGTVTGHITTGQADNVNVVVDGLRAGRNSLGFHVASLTAA